MSFIRQRQEELLKLLGDLVAFRTESPPARNAAAAQEYVAAYLRELGFASLSTSGISSPATRLWWAPQAVTPRISR